MRVRLARLYLFLKQKQLYCICILLYDDDILVTGSSSDAIHTVIQSLQNKLAVNDLGTLNYSIDVERHFEAQRAFI